MPENKTKLTIADNKCLLREWNTERNVGLKPDEVPLNSTKRLWWKCGKGHSWKSTTFNRCHGGNCPYCNDYKNTCEDNSLTTVNPKLAKEWHPTKNEGLTPSDVNASSDEKFWWKCKKNHEWEAVMRDRNKGEVCPFCVK
jgi:hypothetical protein